MSAANILSAAEARARVGGYNGFSFRDIARDTGLTNAGVHHHFPTKSDLVSKLAESYTARFVKALGACPPKKRVSRLRALFSDSLREDGKMCLCGLLASEAPALPDPVRLAVRAFFDDLTALLEGPPQETLAVLAQLEGAALLATILDDPGVFDQATAGLAA